MIVLEADLAVHVVADHHVVVELHEQVTAPGPALELHVVACFETGATIAWWEDDAGTILGVAGVGSG